MATFLDLTRDVIAVIGARYLDVPDIVALSSACKRLRTTVNDNNALFCMLCVRLLGHSAPDTRNQLTTNLGLAGSGVSWREFFQWTYGSTVLTWGTGEQRTGHLRPKAPAQQAKTDVNDADDDVQQYYNETEYLVSEPKVLDALSRQAINFVGKTAEVGSVAVSMGGSRVFVWGNYAASVQPRVILAKDLSPGDRVIEASCGHDTGFVLVFASGRTFVGKGQYRAYGGEMLADNFLKARDFVEFTHLIFGCVINPGERPIQSLGSQSSIGGVLTSEGRVLCWIPWAAEEYCERYKLPLPTPDPELVLPDDADDFDRMLMQAESEVQRSRHDVEPPTRPTKPFDQVLVVDPVADGAPISIAKCAFGHRMWFAIGTDGALYEIVLQELTPRMYALQQPAGNRRQYGDSDDESESVLAKPAQWRRVRGTESISDPVLCVDSGSAHQAFCTAAGDAYTWGATSFGMLGHGDDSESVLATPKRVEYFREIGKRVVAVGAGGYIHWNGAFTLFLCHDNSLYMAGMLGSRTHHPLPTRIDCASLRGRHILSISCGEDWAAVVASASGKSKGNGSDDTEAESAAQ